MHLYAESVSVLSITIPDQCGIITWNFENQVSGVTQDVAEFSNAFRIYDVGNSDPTSPMTDTELLAWTADIAEYAYGAWVSSWDAGHFPTCLVLATVRCAFRATNGHTTAESYYLPSPDLWVGEGDYSLPWSDALVISNYGYVPGLFDPDAKSKRGRAYLPQFAANQLASTPNGTQSTAQVLARMTSYDQMWQAIRAGDYSDVGMSGFLPMPGIVSAHKSAFYRTQYWRCDQILDTQRRRRNREISAYQQLEVLSSS